MDHFLYRNGELHAEDVAIAEIAAQVGTPFYCYSSAALLRQFRLFDEALDGLEHVGAGVGLPLARRRCRRD